MTHCHGGFLGSQERGRWKRGREERRDVGGMRNGRENGTDYTEGTGRR